MFFSTPNIQKMPKKAYTCQVFFKDRTGYYKKVENPQKLATHFDSKNTEWKYLNVYEIDKTKENRCGVYTGLRIYSVNYNRELNEK